MVLKVKVLPENGRTGGQRTSDSDGPGPLGIYTVSSPGHVSQSCAISLGGRVHCTNDASRVPQSSASFIMFGHLRTSVKLLSSSGSTKVRLTRDPQSCTSQQVFGDVVDVLLIRYLHPSTTLHRSRVLERRFRAFQGILAFSLYT